jgi:DNA-binding beta-propeller fold protein YncE
METFARASSSDAVPQSGSESDLVISGQVYNDTNGNLQRDQDEIGFPNLKIDLLKDNNVIDSTTSDQASGGYSFSGLPPGNYSLQPDLPPQFILTEPSDSGYALEITNTEISNLDFGMFKISYQLISDVSFNADIFGFTVEGIATDSDGNIYHADVTDKVIRKFSPNGTLLATIGNGTLGLPGGVALDSAGNIFVSEKFGVVKKYDPSGNLQIALNSTGKGEDQFEGPRGIAIDSKDNLYIADGGRHRIQVYDPSGTYIGTIGSEISQQATANLTQFHKNDPALPLSYLHLPFDTKIDSKGNVWVVDTVNNRIQKFDSSGKFVLNIGRSEGDRPGPQEGSFNRPRSLAIGSNDTIYVADTYYSRIQVFDNNGKFIRTFGTLGSDLGQLGNPSGIAVDRTTGNVYVADSGNARIQVFSPDGKALFEFPTRSEAIEPYFSYIDSSGILLVSDNAQHKVHKFNSSSGHHISDFGGLGTEPGSFRGPRGIATDSEGNIWVADNYNNRVQKFDSDGNSLLTVGKLGGKDGQFRQPRGLVVDSEDNVFVADTQNNRIQKFDRDGNFTQSFATPTMIQPYQIALDKEGNIYVAEAGSQKIEKLDSSGKSLLVFGENGTGPGKFREPRGVSVDSDGNIYTSDQSNRIQKFAPDGSFINEFGNWGSDTGEFFNPRGVYVDESGNLWINDTQNERLQQFDKDGNFMKQIRYSP